MPQEEFEALRTKLIAAIRATKDPAVIATVVIAAARGGYRPEALSQLRSYVFDAIRQDKELSAAIRQKDVSAFLVESALGGILETSGRRFASALLCVHLDDIFPRRPENIPLEKLCLGSQDLIRLASYLRESLATDDSQSYLPLLSIVGAYSCASQVAQETFLELLVNPPGNPVARMNLMNTLANQPWRVLEEPAAFRFLLTCLQERNDPRMPTVAAVAFQNSPALSGGNSPESTQAFTALCEQYDWARKVAPDGRPQGPCQLLLETIASADIDGNARIVQESLSSSSVPLELKLRLLRRINEVSVGQQVDHRYRRTGSALLAAIESARPVLADNAETRDLASLCAQHLSSAQNR
jgi:hypothetical protein